MPILISIDIAVKGTVVLGLAHHTRTVSGVPPTPAAVRPESAGRPARPSAPLQIGYR